MHITKLIKDTIHSASIKEIYDIPIEFVIQPIKTHLDNKTIESFIDTLEDPQTADTIPPIDVLWIEGSEGGNYYYSFCGEHRIEAHKKLNKETIRAKLIKAPASILKVYLGASAPKELK